MSDTHNINAAGQVGEALRRLVPARSGAGRVTFIMGTMPGGRAMRLLVITAVSCCILLATSPPLFAQAPSAPSSLVRRKNGLFCTVLGTRKCYPPFVLKEAEEAKKHPSTPVMPYTGSFSWGHVDF